MIIELKISNFKSHSNTDLKFNNLTILTGLNGCGKTSVIQCLLLLRQSYNKGRLKDGLDLNLPLAEIGIANDALYRNAKSPIITFGLQEDDFDLSFSFNAENNLTSSFIPKSEYEVGLPDDMQLSYDQLSLFNNNFQYISALRWGGRSNYPKDTYLAENQAQISSEKGQCELLGNFLSKHGPEPTYNYLKCDNSEIPLIDQIVAWEQMISPGITIDVEQSPDSTGYNVIYGYRLEDSEDRPINNLRAENVGYGISYSLPVVAAILYAKPNSLIIIENPEAHLHPDGQAELAQLMSLAAERGVQIVVETHSDHIINGVLVACKKFAQKGKGINCQHVAAYYFGGHDEHYASTYETINIKDDGQIDSQPKGFFDRYEEDMDFLNEW